MTEPSLWFASEASRAAFDAACERYAELQLAAALELASSSPPRRVPLDGAAWCVVRIDANRLGYGSRPAHRLGPKWMSCANSMLDAFRTHELNAATAEMGRIEEALT